MKRIVALIVFLFAGISNAWSAPCISGSLMDYINLGSAGCTLSGTLFSDFESLTLPGSATPIDPGSITVNPVSTSSEAGFEFLFNLSAGPVELFESLISYNASGSALTGNSLSMANASAGGDGAVTVVEDKCLGGTFSNFSVVGPAGCSGSPTNLIVFSNALDSDLFEQLTFSPFSLIGIVADVVVDGGPEGTASLGSVRTLFSLGQIVSVPAAATLWLMALGLFGLTIIRVWRV